MKGDDDATLVTFRKGLAQINEKSSPDLVSDLYMIMGDILNKKGLEDESFAAYDSCLQWKDDNVAALNNYAYYISLKGKELHKAEQMSFKTIKAEPKMVLIWIPMPGFSSWKSVIMRQNLYRPGYCQSGFDSEQQYRHRACWGYLCDEWTNRRSSEVWKQSYDAGNKSEGIMTKIKNKRYITEEEIKRMTGGSAVTPARKSQSRSGAKKNNKLRNGKKNKTSSK